MKKYWAFFRLRFTMGLQYRAAAAAGVVTQFFWGAMNILMYRAFYETDAGAFPMSFQATSTYIWLQQAFLALFGAWMLESEIFESIMNGNVAYEMCRPVNIYHMWYSRSMANRLSKALLRCVPILLFAVCIPEPYGIAKPASIGHFILFLITTVLGFLVTVAFFMMIYGITFFTFSPNGLRMLITSVVEFLAGAIIPLPFFPDRMKTIVELLPFASMQNVPLRIYSGSMSGVEMIKGIILQTIWLLILVALGKTLLLFAEKRIVVQGG